jgi:hypothetical protein
MKNLALDRKTIEIMRECKEAGFPLALERSLERIFKDKELVLSLARKITSFETPKVPNCHDIWQVYVKVLSSLKDLLGNDFVAVIESQVIREIESLGCTQCPIYQMELEREGSGFKSEFQRVLGFDTPWPRMT